MGRILAITVLIITGYCQAETAKLQSYSGDTSLPHKLLLAALKEAGIEYSHPYESDKDISNARILNDVKTGALDVMWSMTSNELETEYRAVYIPLFKGLLGMRLALVKAQNRELFREVKNLQDLARFTAGQGKTWPDTKILEANGLPVVKTLKYPNLFYMLEGDRFDYFPRGAHEPWDEIKNHSELNLVVEPYLLLRYTAPLYFFVRKDNKPLADALTVSLERMVADGRFDRMFMADGQVQKVLTNAALEKRRIIDLNNPALSSATPLDNPSLWFDPLR